MKYLIFIFFLSSCATTISKNDNIYLDVYSGTGDIEQWTKDDFDYFVNGLESGEIREAWWALGAGELARGSDYFSDQNKGMIWATRYENKPCLRVVNDRWFYLDRTMPSKYCQLIERKDLSLSYINNLINEGNKNRIDDIKFAQQKAIEQERVRKEREQKRIEKQIRDRELQFTNYIAPFKNQCKGFGYTDENLIAKCVQDYVFADMAAKELAGQLEQLKKQQDAIRFNDALANAGRNLTNLSTGKQVCNFKSWSGAIIQGDCRNLTVKVNGATYWRQ